MSISKEKESRNYDEGKADYEGSPTIVSINDEEVSILLSKLIVDFPSIGCPFF